MPAEGKVLILGIGNELLRDEGVGLRVVRSIPKDRVPEGVDVYEGGTAGLYLLHLLEKYEGLVVVDAVRAGGEPGTIYRFTIEECVAKGGLLRTIHDFDLVEAVRLARLAPGVWKVPKEIVIIGIEPKVVSEFGDRLSPEVEAAVPKAVEAALAEAEALLKRLSSGEKLGD